MFAQEAAALRPDRQQAVDMGGVALAAVGEGGVALALTLLRITGPADRDLRPVPVERPAGHGRGEPDRCAAERRPAGHRAGFVVGQRVDPGKPCPAATMPLAIGRIGHTAAGSGIARVEPVEHLRIGDEGGPAALEEIIRHRGPLPCAPPLTPPPSYRPEQTAGLRSGDIFPVLRSGLRSAAERFLRYAALAAPVEMTG